MPEQRLKPEPKDEPYGLVYFLSHGATGPIKVGFTADRDADSRIRQLQIGSPEPLTLVGTVMAYPSIERAIQTFLGPHLVRGEWFEREPALCLLSRLQMNSTVHQSDFVYELRCLLVLQGTPKVDDEVDDEPLAVRVGHDLLADWVDQLSRVNTKVPLPFRAWLYAQVARKDPIGDLARDVTRDPQFPPTGSLTDYLAFILERAGNAAVTRTLVDAWIECDMAVASLGFRDQDIFDWDKDA